jgi:hypothetical protein
MPQEPRSGVNEDVCPRCENSAVTRADAPDGSGAWFIGTCAHCCFSWRSSEDLAYVLETTEGEIRWLSNAEIDELPVPVPAVLL